VPQTFWRSRGRGGGGLATGPPFLPHALAPDHPAPVPLLFAELREGRDAVQVDGCD